MEFKEMNYNKLQMWLLRVEAQVLRRAVCAHHHLGHLEYFNLSLRILHSLVLFQTVEFLLYTHFYPSRLEHVMI